MADQLIQQLLIINISNIQIYLLWFLLGSFTVATLSDLKHMSAQKEFVQIWFLFVLAMFLTDIYYNYYLEQNIIYLAIKWGIILVFLPVYFHYIRHVAWGDISAKMAACSLLPPVFILIFIVFIRIIDKLTRRLWQKWGKGGKYPFMPVIFFTTMLLIGISLFIS